MTKIYVEKLKLWSLMLRKAAHEFCSNYFPFPRMRKVLLCVKEPVISLVVKYYATNHNQTCESEQKRKT